jgi:hypothetical protein
MECFHVSTVDTGSVFTGGASDELLEEIITGFFN